MSSFVYYSISSDLTKNEIIKIDKRVTIIYESKVDKIRLTNEQIKQFNNLALQLNSGSITMEEAVLELRGGDGLTDVVAVLAFILFVNWYDSFFGAEAFQANPLPHQDPFGW
jgi:hypothetical protein